MRGYAVWDWVEKFAESIAIRSCIYYNKYRYSIDITYIKEGVIEHEDSCFCI